jgi:acetyl-CoA/propionyl-CoA carboxylase biotin carboxyl carrier protein
MNTRIQVEHTITEEVTGIDLVKTQLQVAAGMPLPFTQESIQPRGHAIQCRINAENASRDFKPSPGVLTGLRLPEGPGIRVDSAMFEGAEILPSYDSLIAKLVTWGRDRSEAIARMRRALAEFRVDGLPTTIPFHQRVMEHPVFVAGEATTAFLPEHPEVIPPAGDRVENVSGSEHAQPRELVVEVEGRRLTVRVHQDGPQHVNPGGSSPQRPGVSRQGIGSNHGSASGNEIRSPLQGTVVRVAVVPGATVAAGERVCVVEAMKMENEITAHRSGSIETVSVSAGSTVSVGTVVATIA